MTETRRDEVERIIREGFADMTHEKATEQDMGLSPDALMAAYEAQHAHHSDPGRKGSGLEKAIKAYLRTAKPAPEWQGTERAWPECLDPNASHNRRGYVGDDDLMPPSSNPPKPLPARLRAAANALHRAAKEIGYEYSSVGRMLEEAADALPVAPIQDTAK